MMNVIVAGPDRGIVGALRAEGASVVQIEGIVSRDRLLEAGLADADMLVLTDVEEATAIPVALDENPALRAVVYAPASMPDFVKAQVDLALDPAVLPVAVVAEELVGAG